MKQTSLSQAGCLKTIDDELLDLVDQHDTVIGQLYRSEIYAQKMSNFRAINAFLINDQKQLWIPRRTAQKKMFPLCLDVSVGGHVGAGETYMQAFQREVQEELNIDVATIPYRCLGKFTPHQHNLSAFMEVYLMYSNQTPNFNPQDFIAYAWLDVAAFQKQVEQNTPMKSDLPKLVNLIEHYL